MAQVHDQSERIALGVRSEAKKTGISVHFGQLMTIASIKFFELAKHLQKMKGRIVYRGDCAKDEHGSAAVCQELVANPTSVQGINACVAYGSLPGNCSTAADAINAYVQAYLKGNRKTWIHTAYIGEYLLFRYLKCLVKMGIFQPANICQLIACSRQPHPHRWCVFSRMSILPQMGLYCG